MQVFAPVQETNRPISLARVLWTTLGGFAFVVAIAGIYLPGVPTTGPLLLASYALAKGNPRLKAKLLEMPLLASYRGYLTGEKQFTRAVRLGACASMWLSILVSCLILSWSTQGTRFGIPACIFGGICGTVMIACYRPGGKAQIAKVEEVPAEAARRMAA